MKLLGSRINKVVAIIKKYLPNQAPEVIDEIGIEEIHAPSLALGWKATQKSDRCVNGQEWSQGMVLHTIRASLYVLNVEKRNHE